MLCQILSSLYGRDSRGVQCLNILIAFWWLIAATLHNFGLIIFELPPVSQIEANMFIGLSVAIVVVGVLAMFAEDRTRQILKTAALLFGSLGQILLANGYYLEYPPLDMMLSVCIALSMWYLGAVFYITKCEGLDGISKH